MSTSTAALTSSPATTTVAMSPSCWLPTSDSPIHAFMRRFVMLKRSTVLSFLTAATLSATLAPMTMAGPPLLCHEIQIGDAKSLPWGKDTFDKAKSYDAASVVDDTLKLLDGELPVLARMETIRRAVLYIERD